MLFGFAWSVQRQYPVSSSPTISPTLELNPLLSEKEKTNTVLISIILRTHYWLFRR